MKVICKATVIALLSAAPAVNAYDAYDYLYNQADYRKHLEFRERWNQNQQQQLESQRHLEERAEPPNLPAPEERREPDGQREER